MAKAGAAGAAEAAHKVSGRGLVLCGRVFTRHIPGLGT